MKKLIVVLLFSIIALPSLAQESAGADKPCHALMSILGAGPSLKTGQIRRIDASTCEFRNVSYPADARMVLEIERVLLSKIDMSSVANGKLPPSLRVDATGIRLVTQWPETVPARTRYLMRQMLTPFHVIVDYDHDRTSKVLHFKEISLLDPEDIRLSVDLANVRDLDELGRQLSAGNTAFASVALKSLNFHFDDQGFFAKTILMPVGAALINEDAKDPEAEVEELRRNAIAWIETALSATATTKESIAAITALVADLPKPKKVFDLSIKLSRPISLQDIVNKYLQPDEMKKMLKSVTLTASYRETATKCLP